MKKKKIIALFIFVICIFIAVGLFKASRIDISKFEEPMFLNVDNNILYYNEDAAMTNKKKETLKFYKNSKMSITDNGKRNCEIIKEFNLSEKMNHIVYYCETGDGYTVFRDYLYKKPKKVTLQYSSPIPFTQVKVKRKSTSLSANISPAIFLFTDNNRKTFRFKDDKIPNYYYGIVQDSKIYKLKVEEQKPDEILKFKIGKEDMYFWYFEDLKSKKNPAEYKIRCGEIEFN